MTEERLAEGALVACILVCLAIIALLLATFPMEAL